MFNGAHHFTILPNNMKNQYIASELLENIEEMLPWYYMYSDMLSMFKHYTTK